MNDIGWAVKQLHDGQRVARQGWNGRGMALSLRIPINEPSTLPYVLMRTVTGDFVPWLCSQTDLLATDWEIAS